MLRRAMGASSRQAPITAHAPRAVRQCTAEAALVFWAGNIFVACGLTWQFRCRHCPVAVSLCVSAPCTCKWRRPGTRAGVGLQCAPSPSWGDPGHPDRPVAVPSGKAFRVLSRPVMPPQYHAIPPPFCSPGAPVSPRVHFMAPNNVVTAVGYPPTAVGYRPPSCRLPTSRRWLPPKTMPKRLVTHSRPSCLIRGRPAAPPKEPVCASWEWLHKLHILMPLWQTHPLPASGVFASML